MKPLMVRSACLIVLLLCMLLSSCSAASPSQVAAATTTPAPTTTGIPATPAAITPMVTPSSIATPAVTPSPAAKALDGVTICIDPGHGVTDARKQERVSPKSEETKNAYVLGTSGRTQTEEQLNLIVGKKLKAALEAEGAAIIMTREVSEIALGNIERAQIGNAADLTIRIHADGNDDTSVRGTGMMVPAGSLLANPDIVEPSVRVGQLILDAVCQKTGAKNRGLTQRTDFTGFNWSEVPVILLEMGFMTNAEDDALLAQASYQDKIVAGIVEGCLAFFP